MKLKKDIFSGKGKLYGRAGEEVKIISDRWPAMIVENKSGERYAVNIDDLTDDEVSIVNNEIPIPTHYTRPKPKRKHIIKSNKLF